jgi:hypothetical protein
MSEWQPIETAPKDVSVDLWVPACPELQFGGRRHPDCSWDENYGWWSPMLEKFLEDYPVTPTHWMPLPEPPR